MITFKVLKNAVPFKKLRAKSVEEAKGELRKMMTAYKGDYFELKSPEGKLIPVFSG
jgi:hypothetical protein